MNLYISTISIPKKVIQDVYATDTNKPKALRNIETIPSRSCSLYNNIQYFLHGDVTSDMSELPNLFTFTGVTNLLVNPNWKNLKSQNIYKLSFLLYNLLKFDLLTNRAILYSHICHVSGLF